MTAARPAAPGVRASRRSLLGAALLGLAVAGACTGDDEGQVALPPVPPGDVIPEDVEHIMFGKLNSCRVDGDCASGVCAYATTFRSGTCMGMLSADAPWMQITVGRVLRERIAAQPALRDRVVDRLTRIVARRSAETAHRARAIRALEALGAVEPLAALHPLLEESLGAGAALALTRLGDTRALDHAAAVTEADDEPLAHEALRALGDSRHPDALAPLLRTLSPTLDAELLRATIHALTAHGDRRAVRPLVDFLDRSPEFLVTDTTLALRALTGADLPADVDAWRAWVARESPPEPPPYTPRERSSEDDIGIPTP